MSSNPTKSEATNTETTKNTKEGSDWLGGPQNGSETPGKSTEGAYQQNGQSWLGGPQNGSEKPGESDYTKHRFNETPGEASKQAPEQTSKDKGRETDQGY